MASEECRVASGECRVAIAQSSRWSSPCDQSVARPTLLSMTSIRATKYVIALDCPHPKTLGDFYASLLGWQTDGSGENPDWVNVYPADGSGEFTIACQQVADYRAPEWPDGPIPQQAHLDFYVDSIADSTVAAEAAGAVQHEHQPSEDGSFVVFLDPAGHPFCLCAA